MLFGTRYEATKIGINGFGRIGRMVFQVAGRFQRVSMKLTATVDP